MVITRSRSGRDEIVTVTGHTAWFGKTHHTRFRTVRESRQAHDGEGAQKVSFTKMTLTFSQPPNNGKPWYNIGRDKGSNTDILIDDQGADVILKDTSSNGSEITYEPEDENAFKNSTESPHKQMRRSYIDKKDPSIWVIPVGWIVEVRMANSKARLSFRVPDHTAYLAEYEQKVVHFKTLQNNPFPSFPGAMALEPGPATAINHKVTAKNATRNREQNRHGWIIGTNRLGGGSYGGVYQVFNPRNWTTRAGKIINREEVYRRESSIMQQLEHKHIAQYEDVMEKDATLKSPFMIVMELFALGDLSNQHEERRFTEPETIRIIAQIASALVYLHGEEITHRDLKPENILVRSREPLCVAMADFSVASRHKLMKLDIGTRQYMAPEIFDGDHYYDKQIDMWSLGVLALRLLLEDLPKMVHGMKGEEYAKHIYDQRDRLVDQIEDKEFALLVKSLLAYHASDRPDAEELLRELSKLVADIPNVDSHPRETRPRQAMIRMNASEEATDDSVTLGLKTLKRVHSDDSTLEPPKKKVATLMPCGSRPPTRNYEEQTNEEKLWKELNAAQSFSGNTNPLSELSSVNTRDWVRWGIPEPLTEEMLDD